MQEPRVHTSVSDNLVRAIILSQVGVVSALNWYSQSDACLWLSQYISDPYRSYNVMQTMVPSLTFRT